MRQHSTQVAKPVNRAVISFLTICRQVCDGDLDKALVLEGIIVRMNDHPDFAKLKSDDILKGKVDPIPHMPATVQSIADATKIPRETVRRKVNELVDAGWVEKVDGKQLRLTVQGYCEIDPIREAVIDGVARGAVVTETLLESGNH